MEARLLSGGGWKLWEWKEDTGELVTTESGGGVGANSWLSVCTYDVRVSSAHEHYGCVLSCSSLLALCISSPPHLSSLETQKSPKKCSRESVPPHISGSVSLECAHLECVPRAMPPLLAAIHTSAYNTNVAF